MAKLQNYIIVVLLIIIIMLSIFSFSLIKKEKHTLNTIPSFTEKIIFPSHQSVNKSIVLQQALLAMEEMNTNGAFKDNLTDYKINAPIIITDNYFEIDTQGNEVTNDVIIVNFPAKNNEGCAAIYMNVRDNYLYTYSRGYTLQSIEEQKKNVRPIEDK
jgi:hypothetical protein